MRNRIECIDLMIQRIGNYIQILILSAFYTASSYEILACRSYNTDTTDQHGIDASDTDTTDPIQKMKLIFQQCQRKSPYQGRQVARMHLSTSKSSGVETSSLYQVIRNLEVSCPVILQGGLIHIICVHKNLLLLDWNIAHQVVPDPLYPPRDAYFLFYKPC